MHPPGFSRPDRLALAVALALAGTAVQAASFAVTVNTDNGLGDTAGTLSKAILDANTAAGADTITLSTDVTIAGVMRRLIDSDITLQGDATTRTISGGNTYRPLFVKSGTVTIRNLTLANCKARGGDGKYAGGGAGLGGALFVYSGTVTIEHVSFTSNATAGGTGGFSALNGYAGGGGMFGHSSNAPFGGGGGLFGNGNGNNGGYGGTGAYGGFGGTGANQAGGFGGGGYGTKSASAGGNGGGGAGGFGGGGGYGVNVNGGAGGFGGGGGYGRWANGGSGGFGGGGGGMLGGTVGAGGFGGGVAGGKWGGGGGGLGGAIFVKRGTLALKTVSFSGNSALGGTSDTGGRGQGKGGAIFICTSDLDSDGTPGGAKGGCSGRIDLANTFGVTYSGNTAADGGPDLFWQQCGNGIALPTGQWQMVAAPCVPAGAGTVESTFGNALVADAVNLSALHYGLAGTGWLMYRYNPTANAYAAQTPASAVAPGNGYFIKSYTAPVGGQLVILNGTATVADVPPVAGCASANGCKAVSVSTVAGSSRYNLVGNPFPYNVDWAQVRVRVNGSATTLTPTQAQAANLIASQLWIWNGNTYETWTDTSIPTPGNLKYFQSFWINVLPGAAGKTVELLIPAEQSTHAQATPAPTERLVAQVRPWYQEVLEWVISPAAAATPAPAPEWYVRLTVDNPATGWQDHNTVIGQHRGALAGYDAVDLRELAPFASPYLTMVLPHPEWGAKAGDYGSDFRPADGQAAVWNLEVRADPVGSRVVLRWEGDPAVLQRSELIDRQTGRTIVPTDPNYTDGYPVTLAGKTSRFIWRYLGQ